MAELRWGIATDKGQIRPENEDHVFAAPSLFVVADGMGGHQAGEVASQLAVHRLESRLTDDSPTIQDLVAAIGDANRDIFAAAVENPEQQGMGTTITSLAVMDDLYDGEVFALANVGDSRTYLFRHGRLRQLTIDHSYVQELVSEGHISRDEARHHPRRNIVTRALGIERAVRVDSWTVPIIRGDRFLLCSDGLVDEVTDDEIAGVLATVDDPQEVADELVHRANEHGGRDNVSVVVVDVLEGDEPPDPTQEFDVIPTWAGDDADDPALELSDDNPDAAVGESAAVRAVSDAASDAVSDDGPDGDRTDGTGAVASGDDETVTGSADGAPVRTTAARVLYDGGADVPDDDTEIDPGGASSTRDDTTAGGVTTAETPRRRGSRLVRFLVAVGVAAVVVLGFTIFAAWARDGYFVAFNDTDDVVIFRGRSGGVLWFDPTVEDLTTLSRDLLDEATIQLVEDERRFDRRSAAVTFVGERLAPGTTTTTTTTTVPPTTAPVTSAPATDTTIATQGGPTTGTTTPGS